MCRFSGRTHTAIAVRVESQAFFAAVTQHTQEARLIPLQEKGLLSVTERCSEQSGHIYIYIYPGSPTGHFYGSVYEFYHDSKGLSSSKRIHHFQTWTSNLWRVSTILGYVMNKQQDDMKALCEVSQLKVRGVLLVIVIQEDNFTRWWFQIFIIFTPNFGEDEPILTTIFQLGGSTTN